MRERNVLINVRVTDDEKKVIERKAKRSGLSLSEYIRQSALGKTIKAAPSKFLYEAYQLIDKMNDSRLDIIKDLLLKAYHEEDSS